MHSGLFRFFRGQVISVATIAFMLVIFFTVAPASAQVLLDRAKLSQLPSSTHDIGLTFLSLAGVQPDFDELVKSSAAYKKKPDLAKETFLKTEKANLQAKYLALNPKTNRLTLRMGVKADFQRREDGTSDVTLRFPGDGMVYFPFYYAKYPIALLVNDIEMFQQFGLGADETTLFAAKLDITGEVTLFLDLIPLQADAKNPLKLDGKLQYPLLTKIAVIALLNNKGEQIWGWESMVSVKKDSPLAAPPTSTLSLKPITSRGR